MILRVSVSIASLLAFIIVLIVKNIFIYVVDEKSHSQVERYFSPTSLELTLLAWLEYNEVKTGGSREEVNNKFFILIMS